MNYANHRKYNVIACIPSYSPVSRTKTVCQKSFFTHNKHQERKCFEMQARVDTECGNVDVPGGSSTAMGSRTYEKRCNVHGALGSTWLVEIKSKSQTDIIAIE